MFTRFGNSGALNFRERHPVTAHNENSRHIPALDGLRGLAILLVLFYHFTVIKPLGPSEELFKRLSELGTYGVDLFFVLSGFLVTGILLRTKDRPRFFKNFYMRRVLRIFPLFYLVVLAAFVLIPQLLSLLPKDQQIRVPLHGDTRDWAWYLFFASNFLVALRGKFSNDILDVSWSLAIEEQFYLIWPWIIATLSRNALKKILLGVIAGTLFLRGLLWFSGATTLQIYVLTFTRMDSIAFGALLALDWQEDSQGITDSGKNKRPVFLLGISVVTFFLAFKGGYFAVQGAPMNTFMYTLVAFFFMQLLAWVLRAPENSAVQFLFSNRLMRLMGKYSYAIYLFHVPVRSFMRDVFFGDMQFRHWAGNPYWGQTVFYAAALTVCVILAHLSWNLYEKKFLALKRHFE